MNEIKKLVVENYNIQPVQIINMSGGWLNDKYLLIDELGKKYIFKIFSSKKVEKMSNGEYSSNYFDNQTNYSLKIENYMNNQGLHCPKIIESKSNQLLIPKDNDRFILMEYINGKSVDRKSIKPIQLFNLGKECAIMHNMFESADESIFKGEYLKLPSIEKLYIDLFEKEKNIKENSNLEYVNLIKIQRKILDLIKENNIFDDIPICITHGDFADDNILFCEDIPYILDFELVRKNSYLQDVGRIILSYCFENNNLNIDKVEMFKNGYFSQRMIDNADIYLSLIIVWINEVNMWIKEKYFDNRITDKAKRFQEELIYITIEFENIIHNYLKYKNKSIKKKLK